MHRRRVRWRQELDTSGYPAESYGTKGQPAVSMGWARNVELCYE